MVAGLVFDEQLLVPCGNRQTVFAGGRIVPEFFHELKFFSGSEPADLAGERGVHEDKL